MQLLKHLKMRHDVTLMALEGVEAGHVVENLSGILKHVCVLEKGLRDNHQTIRGLLISSRR